jgi:ribosome-associated translation inhibitor RaiA
MDIHGINFLLTPPLLRHVKRRVKLALAPARPSVTGVRVRLRDLNGPRGGVDKRCRIVTRLRGRGSVVVDAVDRDLYAAVDAAAAKVREAVRRRRKRRRTLRREYAARRPQRQAA